MDQLVAGRKYSLEEAVNILAGYPLNQPLNNDPLNINVNHNTDPEADVDFNIKSHSPSDRCVDNNDLYIVFQRSPFPSDVDDNISGQDIYNSCTSTLRE